MMENCQFVQKQWLVILVIAATAVVAVLVVFQVNVCVQ